jgi:hypothetical protein
VNHKLARESCDIEDREDDKETETAEGDVIDEIGNGLGKDAVAKSQQDQADLGSNRDKEGV